MAPPSGRFPIDRDGRIDVPDMSTHPTGGHPMGSRESQRGGGGGDGDGEGDGEEVWSCTIRPVLRRGSLRALRHVDRALRRVGSAHPRTSRRAAAAACPTLARRARCACLRCAALDPALSVQGLGGGGTLGTSSTWGEPLGHSSCREHLIVLDWFRVLPLRTLF